MKSKNIFIFGNNRVCLEIIKLLNNHDNLKIVGICLHEKTRQKYTDEIKHELCNDVKILEVKSMPEGELINEIKMLDCDMGFSIYYGYIISKEIIDLFPRGIINVHPAYLPYNRGSAPNIFSLVDRTPSGVTLHYIDEGIDTGNIILQEMIKVESIDTGKSLYVKLEELCLSLFKDLIPLIHTNNIPVISGSSDKGTFHNHSELAKIDKIDLDETYIARDLINLLRARTFFPYESAYFIDDDGKKVFVRVDLNYE